MTYAEIRKLLREAGISSRDLRSFRRVAEVFSPRERASGGITRREHRVDRPRNDARAGNTINNGDAGIPWKLAWINNNGVAEERFVAIR